MPDATATLVGETLTISVNLAQLKQNGGIWSFSPPPDVEPLAYNEIVMSSLQFTTVNGQSLAETHVGGCNETLASPFAAKAFPRDKTTTTFADLINNVVATDLTITAGTVAQRDGEAPVFGLLAMGYDLARPLKNIDTLPRLGVDRGYGSTAIEVHVKGQAYYTNTINCLTAAKAYATSIGLPIFDLGFAWFQGEGNAADTKAAYQAKQQGLARDGAGDRKAITGQADDPAMFTYITDSIPVNGATRSGVARAQHQSCIDYFNGVIPAGHTAPAPVILACPTYFMLREFDPTGVHVAADLAHVLGDYVALAQFHCYQRASDQPLNKRWPPIHPIDVDISADGKSATITYQMRTPGTSLEMGVAPIPNGDGIPAQTNKGYGVHDGTGLRALSSVEVVAFNQVRITLESGTFGPGYRIGYALDYAPVGNFFATQAGGSTGNLRDNYGNKAPRSAMNLPLHNWVAPHDITLGSGGSWSLS